jgi:hypothetical protein
VSHFPTLGLCTSTALFSFSSAWVRVGKGVAAADGKFFDTFVIDRGTVVSAGSTLSGDVMCLFQISSSVDDSCCAGKLGVVGRNGWYTEEWMLNIWCILSLCS